jgi:hypothetical protein
MVAEFCVGCNLDEDCKIIFMQISIFSGKLIRKTNLRRTILTAPKRK